MASKSKWMGIIAWSLVVLLLIGVGAMALMGQKQGARADGFRDALLKVGAASGVEGLTPESLEGEEALTASVQQLEGAVLGDKQELLSTKDALGAARTEVSTAQAQVSSLSQGSEELKAQVDSLSKELAAKGEQLDAAKAEAAKLDEAVKKAEQLAGEKAELEKAVEDLKKQMEEETAGLQAELDAARQQAAAMGSPDSEAVAGAAALSGAAVAADMEMEEPQMQAEEEAEEIDVAEEEGRVIAQSAMFSLIRHSVADETLFFQLIDGQTLSYQNVPLDVADDLLTSEDNLDMKYRFKIQGVYKSIPPDSIVIRKFWKNQRHRRVRQDLVLIEDDAPAAAEEEAVVVEEDAAGGEEAPPAE